MKTKRTKKACTAKKRAIILAMAAITGASVSSMSKAERAAMNDMEKEYGSDCIVYSWDPFDGLLA